MGQETESVPKPMVRIAGDKPILWHVMKGYASAGYGDFVLCLGYKGDVIRSYFLNYGTFNCDFTVKLGRDKDVALHNSCEEEWDVTLVDTGLDVMTGARIKQIERYVEDDLFMLTYGDGVANIDIGALLTFHREHGKIATVTGVQPPSRFGQLGIEGDLVNEFLEKPVSVSGGVYINGGFFVFQRAVFEYLSEDPGCILERDPLQRLAEDGELAVFRHDGFWQCMDTVRDLEALSHALESGNAPWMR
jgi:glucose-1-phosphate cytidylyltransferase